MWWPSSGSPTTVPAGAREAYQADPVHRHVPFDDWWKVNACLFQKYTIDQRQDTRQRTISFHTWLKDFLSENSPHYGWLTPQARKRKFAEATKLCAWQAFEVFEMDPISRYVSFRQWWEVNETEFRAYKSYMKKHSGDIPFEEWMAKKKARETDDVGHDEEADEKRPTKRRAATVQSVGAKRVCIPSNDSDDGSEQADSDEESSDDSDDNNQDDQEAAQNESSDEESSDESADNDQDDQEAAQNGHDDTARKAEEVYLRCKKCDHHVVVKQAGPKLDPKGRKKYCPRCNKRWGKGVASHRQWECVSRAVAEASASSSRVVAFMVDGLRQRARDYVVAEKMLWTQFRELEEAANPLARANFEAQIATIRTELWKALGQNGGGGQK